MLVGPYNLIVPVGVLQNSSDVFNILDPDSGGSKTFSVRLSANGLEPATYWGASTWLEEATVNALKNMTTTQFKAYVDQVAAQRRRTPIGSITAFKNALLMDNTMSFWDFIASQGLQRIEVLPA
jgi:hypothetical protein